MIIVSFGLSHYSLSTTVNGLINHQVGDSIIAVNWETHLCTMHNKISNFLCFASLCAHLSAISNNFNCNDANKILGK